MFRPLLVSVVCASVLVGAVVSCKGVTTSKNQPAGPRAGEGVTLPEGGVFRRVDLLQAFGECAKTNAHAFVPLAEELAKATKTASEAPSPESRAAARKAWENAIDHWEKLEVLQYGPGGPSSRPGGKEIRESIYSWPLGGRCLVEQILAGKGYEADTFATGLVSTRGLLAIEYLLYYEPADNACAPTATLNASGSWTALGEAEIAKRKLAYAAVAAADLVKRARELDAAWDPAGGNFMAELTSAGSGSKLFASDQIALNTVSDSLFYVDFETKDMKVARPAGLMDCTTPTCPEALESTFAKRSKIHVRNNLLGAKLLLGGCGANGDGLAFDDLLRAIGQGPLADDLLVAADGAIAAVDAIEEPDLDGALVADLESVKNLHAAIKRLTDRLKTDFVSILDLEIPKRVEGDND